MQQQQQESSSWVVVPTMIMMISEISPQQEIENAEVAVVVRGSVSVASHSMLCGTYSSLL